ncbi:MAG: CHAT domain-containing protein [candidate division Zixibacteria bacterium]|nr:CHAT domain-containing protein [candidate division Zixibacteria bacterium]MDH3936478.1 CHAT domain-containing protein [candidate division Zixibacteria bacterium]MDH4033700.1 CHAT domain-containing protein [candidate division Zixibacteria bacterium]
MVRSDKNTDVVIRVFLSSGDTRGVDPQVLADGIDQKIRLLAQSSLRSALVMARDFVKQSKGRPPVLLSTALRSLGRVSLAASDYSGARKAYLQARKMLQHDWLVRGQVDRTLIDIYMYLDDYRSAKRHAKAAMATFQRHRAFQELAKTKNNYGNLFHRQDRHREASRMYDQAYRVLRKGKDKLSTGLCCYNRANTLVQLFDFTAARLLYEEAERHFEKLSYHLYANEARYGLAWLSMLEGDYHLALQALSECEHSYKKAGRKKGVVLCQLDRAEAYLGLNLFGDARDTARLAERNARKLGIEYESAKAAFFCGKSMVGLGRGQAARKALERAESGFTKTSNAGFQAAVHFLKAQLESSDKEVVAKLRSVSRRFAKSELPLWEAICDFQLMDHCPDDLTITRRVSKNPAIKAVPHLKAHWQTLLGDREAANGHAGKARKHWRVAVDILDAVRAKLPPVEMRSGFVRHRCDPYLRLIESELTTRPVRAAAWSERYKTAGLWAVPPENLENDPVRQKAERSLVDLAARVTAVAGRPEPSPSRSLAGSAQGQGALRALQARVRHDLSAIERQARTDHVAFGSLLKHIEEVSLKKTLVQFLFQADELIAFVHQRGQSRVCRFPHGRRMVEEFVSCWNFVVAREQLNRRAGSKASLQEERQLLEQLGQNLWAPMEIGAREKSVVIIPDGRLANLPWQAFRCEGDHLIARHRLTFSPSLLHHVQAKKRRIRSDRIELFVGRTDDLRNARAEVRVLKEMGNGSVVVRDPCRRADWPDKSEARLWHYTGHAQWRPDNPFYSSLTLADGPLFAADFRLKRNKVGLVVLAACRTGRTSVLPGDEADGLVRSLLEMGAKSVLASHWAVSDRSTAYWMRLFYNRLRTGETAANAATKAAIEVREKYPSAYDWSAFSISGAG